MKKAIRILHIVGVMDQGGVETLLMNIYRNIDKSMIQFDFLTHSTQKGFFDDEIKLLGGKIYSVISPFSLKGIFQYKKQLTCFFTKHPEHTIVHSHMNTFSGMILNIIKSPKIKTRIAHSHTTLAANKIKTPLSILAKFFGQNAITHYFSCSQDAAKWGFGKYSDQAIIFKNAIELEKYQFSEASRKQYRNKLNLKNKYVVGHVGRFNEIKNHNFLINIHENLIKKEKDARLLLVGDGPLLSTIKKKVQNRGLHDSVIFLGNREDVDKLLCAIDIFVFPSINEGLGIVAIEAQTSGLNCLVSDTLPSEVKVTPLLKYLSLDSGSDHWALHIQKYKKIKKERDKFYLKIKKQGYDIKEMSIWLQKFYLKCNKENEKRT